MGLLMMCSLFLYQYTPLALDGVTYEYFTIKLQFSFMMILTFQEISSFSKEKDFVDLFTSECQLKSIATFYTTFLNISSITN